MGFFGSQGLVGGAMGLLTGGSKANSYSNSASQSGFSQLPATLQQSYLQYGGQLNNLFGNQGAATSAFTPKPINMGEQTALNNLYQGFTPDSQRLQSDISMLQNPYDQYVINDINSQAQGQNSLVNQAATQAGQQGSNRSFLGTSDVENQRLNTIGKFRQDNYNNAINASLGALTDSRRADAAGMLSAGAFERDLAAQTSQAPYTSMLTYAKLLGILPTDGGSVSTGRSESQSKSSNGIAGLWGGGGG